MTDDEIVGDGERARALLENPVFIETMTALSNDHLNGILGSSDEDAAGREKHFRQLRSYEAILAHLRGRVEAALKVLNDRAAPYDTEDETP